MASKEGVNRAERGGKDEHGSYGGPASTVTDPLASGAKTVGDGASRGAQNVSSGAQGIGSSVTGGAKSAGGYVSSLWGGGKKE